MLALIPTVSWVVVRLLLFLPHRIFYSSSARLPRPELSAQYRVSQLTGCLSISLPGGCVLLWPVTKSSAPTGTQSIVTLPGRSSCSLRLWGKLDRWWFFLQAINIFGEAKPWERSHLAPKLGRKSEILLEFGCGKEI